MLSRYEFCTALVAALAALSPPETGEPMLAAPGKPGLDSVCFDFWPGESLRIVGTNGRRLVVVYAHVLGLPKAGKFLMPVESAREALQLFAPFATDGLQGLPQSPRVSLALFGLEQMIVTSGGDALMVPHARYEGTTTNVTLYPEYHLMLNGDTLPSKGAIFDPEALRWALDCAGYAQGGNVQLQVRAHGPTTVRPKLSADFESIHDIIFAIKPVGLVS